MVNHFLLNAEVKSGWKQEFVTFAIYNTEVDGCKNRPGFAIGQPGHTLSNIFIYPKI